MPSFAPSSYLLLALLPLLHLLSKKSNARRARVLQGGTARRQALTHSILGAAIAVHRGLGPGLLESAYHRALVWQLTTAGLRVEEQVPVDLVYGEVTLETAYRMDLLVEGEVVVEVKSVEHLRPIHGLQLATYLRLGNFPYGLLINFNTARLMDGVQRKRNDRYVRARADATPSPR